MPSRGTTTERLLGQLLTQQENHGRELGEIKRSLNDLKTEVATLQLDKAAARGGFRVLAVIGSVLATIFGLIGGFAGKLLAH